MFKSASLALFAFALGARAVINVSTPGDSPQCSSFTFNVSGDTPGPYFAYIMESDAPCGNPVSDEITVDPSSGNFNWTAPNGGRYVAVVDNQDGTVEGWSWSFNVQDEGISNCATVASSPSSTSTTSSSTTIHPTTYYNTGAHGATTNAPVNAAQTTGTGSTSQTGGASRSAVGGFTALTLVGAVAAILSI